MFMEDAQLGAKALMLPGASLAFSKAADSLGLAGGKHLPGPAAAQAGQHRGPGLRGEPVLTWHRPSPAGTAKTLGC